jgi:hypothetical protein
MAGSSRPAAGSSANLSYQEGGSGDGGGGGVYIGDPDVPTTPGKGANARTPGTYGNGSVSTSVEAGSSSTWMIRLQVALRMLMMRWIGI